MVTEVEASTIPIETICISLIISTKDLSCTDNLLCTEKADNLNSVSQTRRGAGTNNRSVSIPDGAKGTDEATTAECF